MIDTIKNNLIAIIVCALLLFFGITQCKRADDFKDKYEIEANNVEVLTQGQKNYKIKDSINASQITALQLSADEFERLYKNTEKELKYLKDHPKKETEYITKFNTITDTKWKIDTLYIEKDSCKVYSDGFTTVNLCKDSIYIQSVDSISQFISKHYKHKFLWFKWKVDGVTQDIYNKNPNSRIIFDNFIKIQ